MRLAIDFGGTNIKIGLLDDQAAFLDRKDVPLADFPPGKAFFPDFLDYLEHYLNGRSPEFIGMATKGGVRLDTAEVSSDIGAGQYLIGAELRKHFESRFKALFYLDNDARAYALGEYSFGAGRGSNTLLCMTLGTGVGSALVHNGMPYATSDPVGGLLGGHISIDRQGIPCSCGNKGCLEGYVSATALLKMIDKNHPELLNGDTDPIAAFFEAGAREPESLIGKHVSAFQNDLTLGLVNIIHAYSPDRIVIGGGVARSASVFLPRVVEMVSKMAWTSPRGATRIIASELGDNAALLGMAFHPLLKSHT